MLAWCKYEVHKKTPVAWTDITSKQWGGFTVNVLKGMQGAHW